MCQLKLTEKQESDLNLRETYKPRLPISLHSCATCRTVQLPQVHGVSARCTRGRLGSECSTSIGAACCVTDLQTVNSYLEEQRNIKGNRWRAASDSRMLSMINATRCPLASGVITMSKPWKADHTHVDD
jgi:hypothetical protein